MEARECLLNRRSVRRYLSDPVPDEVLERIMECALAAPSATNRQHWYFVVVRSPEGMEELHQIMKGMEDTVLPALLKQYSKFPEVAAETIAFLRGFGNAPACVLAFCLKPEYSTEAGRQSVCAAIENLLLGAWSEGVGTCWMAAPWGIAPQLQERYAPGKGDFVAAISLGYPERVPAMPARKPGRCEYI